MKHENEKKIITSQFRRRLVAMLLAVAQCLTLLLAGTPAAYAEIYDGGEVIRETRPAAPTPSPSASPAAVAGLKLLEFSNDTVKLYGRAPAGTNVYISEVSEDYRDFDPRTYGVLEEGEGEQLLDDGADDQALDSVVKRTLHYRTLNAQDIGLSYKNADYKLEKGETITVTIKDRQILGARNVEVWQLDEKDGAKKIEQAEAAGETVTFTTDALGVCVVTEVTVSTQITTADGQTYSVSVSYEEDAELPDAPQLSVRELSGEELEDCVARGAETLESETLLFVRALDISLLDPETGAELQPASGVRVSIRLLGTDFQAADRMTLTHFGDAAETVDYTLSGDTVEFEADGFSVYMLAGYTVDFHSGSYTFSIAGESEILLSALLEKLNLTEIAPQDVAEVRFSNPELVDIIIEETEEQTADWLLRSLAPFDTEETLTLTLKNGKSVEIKVTDAQKDHGTWENGSAGSGTWSIDENGVLTISGTGKMVEYNGVTDTPWYKYINKNSGSDVFATKIVFENGITTIGKNSFTRAYYLEEINAQNCTTLTTIGESAFKQTSFNGGSPNNKSNPKRIDFSGCTSLNQINSNAFQLCEGIQYLDISGTQLSINHLSNTTAGFGAKITVMQTLKANNCTNLSGTLDLSGYTSLTTLELSGCTGLNNVKLPSSLTTLDVSGCTGLSSLENISNCTSLTSLNLSGCDHLNTLTLPANVTTLDVTGCTAMTNLDASACVQLTDLDVSGCTSLGNLNLPANIRTLDVSGCSSLPQLNATNCTQLTDMNVSGCSQLNNVYVPANITTLDVSDCTHLIALDLSNCDDLTSLNVANCTTLRSLDVPDSVTTLDISGCTNLNIDNVNVPENITVLKYSNRTELQALDVSGYSSLAELYVSGCTNLTSLILPDSVTKLDASGCTSLPVLDISNCTGLTSLDVSGTGLTELNVSNCTGLTSLDVSGTGLTELDVSNCTGLTSLNASNCTGLTVLDLSATSLTNINVSNSASLTALKLPATVTALDISGCSEGLVLYFDGKAEDLPDDLIPAGKTLISWGDYSYTIEREGSAALHDIFTGCKVPNGVEENIESVLASNSALLQVLPEGDSYTVTNLLPFEDPQSLSITLKNGLTGAIQISCAALLESDILNDFLDANSTYSINDGEEPRPISQPAVLAQADVLHVNLSFSEIPEGEEGERQMKLLAPLYYTLPENFPLAEGTLPASVTITVESGEDSKLFPANLTVSNDNRTLTIKGNYGDEEEYVRNSTKASFELPFDVNISTLPCTYVLGNGLTLSANSPHNVKISSLTAGAYDEENETIEYTVTVEADSDLDFGGKEYLVRVEDGSVGTDAVLSFVSGSYTYTHSEEFNPPADAPASQVNSVNVQPGEAASFSQFPLTVSHMYAGDKIIFTYQAKVLKSEYKPDGEAQQHYIQNTVENVVKIFNEDSNGNPNPYNNPDDDEDSVTNPFSYIPLLKRQTALEGNWAHWEITVNPKGYTLNSGEPLTLTDNFNPLLESDGKPKEVQTIEYSSVKIDGDGVSYDYSGSTGTFEIPDNTPVIITYRTRIKGQPGENVHYANHAELRTGSTSEAALIADADWDGWSIIYPSASDVAGFGSNYMVRLYVYADKAMQKGIEGASFILLDANQRALEYKLGENKGQPVTFTTGPDGYVNIELHEEDGDVSIEKNTGYYLEMMQAVPGYQKDNTLYSFMITDDPSYSSGGFYKYYNGDTMKVRLYAATAGLRVSIRFSGSYTLRDDQKDNVTAVLQQKVNQDWVEVERHPYTDSKWGTITFAEVLYDPDLGQFQNHYRVIEENQSPWDLPEDIHQETTYYYVVNADEAQINPDEFSLDHADDAVSVVIDNRYEEPQLTIDKMDKTTGTALPGAVFSVYKIVYREPTGDAVTSYTSDSNGEIVIRGGETYVSEMLYGIKETAAPSGYLLPKKDEWHYFYFCNDPFWEEHYLEDHLPEGATAINLTDNGDRVSIHNQKKEIDIPVMKIWQQNNWPDNVQSVLVGLYQSVNGGAPEQVKDENGEALTVVLTKATPYNNTAFTGMPARDDQNNDITYSILEERVNSGQGADILKAFVQEYGVSDAGVYVVRNKPATKLTVTKEWYDWEGAEVEDADVLAEQSSVTYDVYRSSKKFEDSTPEDGITNADMTAFVRTLTKVRENLSFGAADGWTKEIDDLDKQDDLGKTYYYYILETVPSFGNELYVIDEDEGTIEIRNKIAPDPVNLTVTKAALVGDPREESLDRDFTFTLKLQKDDTHPIRSWTVFTDEENPEKNLVTDFHGEVSFTLKPTNPELQTTEGASITLSLPQGVTAKVTEAYNPEYTVDTSATDTEGHKGDEGRSFRYETNSTPVTLTYTNTLHVICKVVDNGDSEIPFESLKSALAFLRENPGDFTEWTIYMLEDYVKPETDVFRVNEDETVILTTAATDPEDQFPFKPPASDPERDFAIISRGGVGGSMLENKGTLTLEKICLDGRRITVTCDGGLVHSTGTLNLSETTTLRNSETVGKGGAVYGKGTVNIVDGVSITGNSADSAAALYLQGTLNMRGGSIKDNRSENDGAVVAEHYEDQVNLSGKAVIFNNTKDDAAANLYIGAYSDSIVNVVEPGLAPEAKIGVYAMDGHRLIGEQFAVAEFGQTQNLKCFVNDIYGYHGKLKDGSSTNIIWNGLTISIKKAVESKGGNPNDRFTITLISHQITQNKYIIDGTLDYEVTPVWNGRNGRIVLRNIKANDEIVISPLPVGTYTVEESSSSYTPSYSVTAGETPIEMEGTTFNAEDDCTVTVTNTRKLATVTLRKTLDNRLAGDTAVPFNFTVQLIEADGTPVQNFPLADGITTGADGSVSFPMNPKDLEDEILEFLAPVEATMTITETENPVYRVSASANTRGEESSKIENLSDEDNVFKFEVTEDGAFVTFENVLKMAVIELSKTLAGKVSKTESYTFTLTLKNANETPVKNYVVYRNELKPEDDIITNDDGVATITLTFGEDETGTKSIPLTIPDGTKLTVEETDRNGHPDFYTTAYVRNGGAAVEGTSVTIDNVSETDTSIAFTNARKMNTIVVKNAVNGYSGNVVPFHYTATVTDGGENQDDYDDNGFTNGVMSFDLTKDQTQTLTVPYGATLTVTEDFIVGYGTTVKRGSAEAVEKLSDTFVVTGDLLESEPILFTNSQLIGLRIVNETSSELKNVTITVGKNKIYRVNSDETGQELIGSNKTAKINVAPGETAILEIEHDTSVTAEQNYTVKGTAPAAGFYYTIVNEPSFHETANPAILRVYDTASFEVKGKLRYSVQDSTVTFTEQPLVSFDVNGGAWTTAMDGYRDRDGDRQVYQKAVNTGDTVSRPNPVPIYPTAEGIEFLGWTTDEQFAKASHTAGEDISAKAYNFDTPVTAPMTLYAVWAKPARDERVVTVKNGHNESLNVTATLTQNAAPVSGYDLADGLTTDADGKATFTLAAGESKNLTVPNGVKLELALESESLAVSSEYTLTASADQKSYTIASVTRDGTVTFIPGVCKITDESGNVLYDGNGKPAVYGTLDAAFTAYGGTLYTDASHTTAATQAAVKMLVDEYTINSAHAFPTNAPMTLTTAGKDDTDFPYLGIREYSTLYRSTAGANGNCFTLAAGNITLTDIILDGGSENGVKIDKTKNGGLIFMNNASGVLNVTTGTTMRNCEFAAYDDANNSRGGAIYMTNGTLNVDAGLFSNLHAYQGGAICVTGGTLNVTGTAGSTRFEDCRSERQDGGAIYYNRGQDLLIDGGEDRNNPGIIFTRCVAAYTTGTGDGGDGGGIFATSNYTNTVTVKGCAFIECSARTGNGSSTAGYGGGGICAYKVKGLTVEACSFDTCDTLCGGGAVAAMVKYTETVANETVTIKNCSFNQCNCKGQAGALGVYQDNNGATNSATKLSVINSTFDNCSSGTNNGSGGAIQCYLPCMVFTGSSFSDCWAGKEGGAVNNFFGSNYTQEWSKSFMTVTDCSFIRCRAEDRYDTTALQHYGGGINTKAKTVTVTNSTFEDCVSTLREGGALHIGGQGTGSKATITGSTFKNCTAKNGGGALLSSHETLEISDSFFYGCGSSASNGGAVYHYQNSRGTSTQKNLTITNSTFSKDPDDENSLGCSATGNGGAIWTRAENVSFEGCTIDGCTAGGNGGGIYLKKNTTQTAIITSKASGDIILGTITNCQATNGSAVYVEDKATFSGALKVSGNTVSNVDSGAIHGGTLYFEGNVVVEDNTSSAEPVYNHDVFLHNDSNATINTTAVGLGSEANIGVYVIKGQVNKHGLEGKPFGTYGTDDGQTNHGANYLDSFFNNRDGELFGYQASATDSLIYWGIYVCKITDAEGNTLTRPNGRDAIYQRLSQALDEFTLVTGGEPVYIKMLIEDYKIRQTEQIENFPAANITLTTETYTGTDPVPGKYDGKHPYRGKEGSVCTISRDNSNNQLFKLNNADATFQLENITLDGRKNKTTSQGNYRLIEAAEGALVINGGTTLQYGAASNGGAIEAAEDARVTINGVYDAEGKKPTVRFVNCTGTGNSKPNGGAIRASNLNIYNSSENIGEFGTVFLNCSAYNGGAITSLGTSVEINGVFFDNCRTQSAGGAIYHNNSDANGTTTVKNCAFENCLTYGSTAWAHGGAVEARAGTLSVEDCSFKACSATSDGGAVYHGYVDGSNNPSGNRVKTTIKNTTFEGCSTTGTDKYYNYGGSVYTQAKTVEVIDSSFKDSTATNHGGALYCQCNVDGSTVTISGSKFDSCATSRSDGNGGAIYSKTKALTLQDYSRATETGTTTVKTEIVACTAPNFSGAVHMETTGSNLSIKGSTRISECYAKKGGAIYLPANVTMDISDSPEFSKNGYTVQNGAIVEAAEGACIYLEEGGQINLQGSPQFIRNLLPNQERITNGAVLDNVQQDIFLAGYSGKQATSIYVLGELTGSVIWVWPEKDPHRLANDQFAKIAENVSVSAVTLGKFRNALADEVTNCADGEFLAGVQIENDPENVYWDKMYSVFFNKIDNKAVPVPGAGFTLYKDLACEVAVATAVSANGNIFGGPPRGRVEFSAIRIGAYYMKETGVPVSFKDNTTTYLVLVGTPYLSPSDANRYLWEDGGPLDVPNAPTQVIHQTTNAGLHFAVFPLDANNKAILKRNLALDNAGIENIRNDFQVSFMKVDGNASPLPHAFFTIYSQILDEQGNPQSFSDGYPMLERWSRDGETYPAPVDSADGSDAYKDIDNKPLPKGLVYFRELPIGTYYLLETAYPERDGSNRRTFYLESDRVFKLEVTENEESHQTVDVTLSQWNPETRNYDVLPIGKWNPETQRYEERTGGEGYPKDGEYYMVSNQEVVCKLTDESDNLLYTEGHAVWDSKNTEGVKRLFPAIYHTLESGFTAAQSIGSFVYEDGNPVDMDNLELKLKVLKDFDLTEAVLYNSSREITFTTAETKAQKDRYIFSTQRTSDSARAHINRAYNADISEDANDGALITLASGTEMTLETIRLNGNSYNGRAIRVTEGSKLSIQDHTRIENFKQKASESSEGSNLKGGAILLDDGTGLTIDGGYNRTAIFSGNMVVNNRETEKSGADGGAIAVGKNCTFNITNAQFIGNSAVSSAEKKGNGGAVSINETKDAEEMMNLPIHNVVFTSNTASYQGGAIRVAENCSLLVDNCSFSNNQANTVPSNAGEGGAIAVLSNKEAASSLTINGGTFTGNTAAGSKGGAVKIGGYGTLKLSGNVTMQLNTAAYGGAITIAPGAQVNMESATIRRNEASEGSAVYVEDYAKLTVTNADITGNKAKGINGGAINTGGVNARLFFGGTLTVFDNFGADGENQQMNLVLSEDSDAIINTTADGLNDGIIGVFVIETEEGPNPFEKHGLPGKPFGTFGDAVARANPQVFRSDHSLSLYGVRNESDPNDTNIYWVDVICKLTDESNEILFQDITLKISGKKETRKAQAVYARITKADEQDQEAIEKKGFNALRDGFDAAQGTLYVRDESTGTYTFSEFSGTTVKLKMLQDVVIDKSIQAQGTRRIVFTTAETQSTQSMKDQGDYFPFVTGRTEDTGRAHITRGFDDSSMIQDKLPLTLTNILLDGENYQINANGGIVHVAGNASLTVEADASLVNANTTGSGGAIYASGSSAITVSGGTINGNSTTGNGGAIYAASGSALTVSGGTINGNRAASGAGIYLSQGSVLNLSGAPYFGGTGVENNALVTAYESGEAAGNFINGTVENEKNGGKDYTTPRQDVYITGTENPHASIRVTDSITSGNGTIWVWADNVNHYEMLKQFAIFSGEGIKLSETIKDSTMKAFRDAQYDRLTNCGGEYLTGQKGETENWIYWNGGFDVKFLKIDAFGKALDGATFTLYQDFDCKTPLEKSGQHVTAVSANGTDQRDGDGNLLPKGTVFFPKVPNGIYFMRETEAPDGYINSIRKDDDGKDIPNTYVLLVGEDNLVVPDSKTGEWLNVLSTLETSVIIAQRDKYKTEYGVAYDKYALFLIDSNNKATTIPNLAEYGVMNLRKAERKVILDKVNAGFTPLPGAKFDILRYDLTPVVTNQMSTDSGAFWIGKLPYGSYYLHETTVPNAGNNAERWFTLTVDENGVSCSPQRETRQTNATP